MENKNTDNTEVPAGAVRLINRKRRSASFLLSLRGRLLFLISLTILPAVLFTFLVAERERAAMLVRTEQEALHLAGLAGREHAHQIRGARELLSWLGTKVTHDGLRSPVITDPTFLRALLAGHPQLVNIGVLSAEGQVLTSAYPLTSYQSWKDNPVYLAALDSKDVVAGSYTISPIVDRPTLNHALAVRDGNNEVIAVLFNGLDLGWLSEISRQSNLPDQFSLLVSDADGRVFAWSDPAQPEIASMEEIRIENISELSKSQHGRMHEVHSGVRRYFVATPLEATGLFVVAGLPYDSFLRQVNRTFYRTFIGLAALLLFTVAAVFIATELGILRGIRSLSSVAQRLGAGDLSARAIVPRGHSEFSSLAMAFNSMADGLNARHHEAVAAQARLRALASRLQVVRETEAARISRELHDEIGQVLTSLKIDLSRLPLHCATSDQQQGPCTAKLREDISTMSQKIDAAINFVRHISSELRPGVLDKLGLIAALEWQARATEAQTDLIVEMKVTDDIHLIFNESLSVTLFRIVQETLTNVIRHAEARIVEINLEITAEETVVLTVRDDGKGIEIDSIESNESVGIIGMRERVMLINGHLSISGVPGQGTTVSVTAPLKPKGEVTDAHSTS